MNVRSGTKVTCKIKSKWWIKKKKKISETFVSNSSASAQSKVAKGEKKRKMLALLVGSV